MYSGGLVSWATAEVACHLYGPDNVELIFADTLIEDEDLYRFLDETVKQLGCKYTRLCDGRTPWEVFEDVKFIGNSRIDPCSRILKREIIRKYLDANYDPAKTTIHIGFSWDEMHRFDKAKPYWNPWTIRAPLTEDGYQWTRAQIEARLQGHGIALPRLYAMGFAHNNCGGFCVKAGHAQFKALLEQMPERYAAHEREEAKVMDKIGTASTVMKDRRGGTTKPLSMQAFRERLVVEGKIDDDYDWGGCGCFYPLEYTEET
jgi:hypothetical protein